MMMLLSIAPEDVAITYPSLYTSTRVALVNKPPARRRKKKEKKGGGITTG
jgi:hypothetical protein